MIIGIHDGDAGVTRGKKYPNLALMRISAYHKGLGDTVVWWSPMETCDKVYSSKVFDFTPADPYLPPDAIRGGTGYRDIPLNQVLPDEIDKEYPDYSIYQDCDYAVGYLTRGCPNHCRWCVVPKKEGDIHPYRDWQEVVRPDSDKLVLMDNNILAIDYGIEQLQSMIGSGYKSELRDCVGGYKLMVKEWLSRYGVLKKAAERTEAEMQRLRSQAESITQHITDMPGGGAGRNKLEDAVKKIDELEEELGREVLEAISVRKEIAAAIEAVENPVYKELLKRRYIDGDKWEIIAEQMNYCYKHMVHILHPRALRCVEVS